MYFIANFAEEKISGMRFIQKFAFSAIVVAMFASIPAVGAVKDGRIVVAYVTSWTDEMPMTDCVDYVNYAFGHINATFDSVRVDNPERLKQLLELKNANPNLKVLLSIGGWGSGGFSEMAADARKRRVFAWDCRRLIWDMGIDGIDIDWEYPTQSGSGIKASPEDTENFSKLIKEIRTAIGPKRTLTVATISSGKYVDFRNVNQYVDFYNVMCYDMGLPPFHNAPLYRSDLVENISVSEAVDQCVWSGMPKEKIVLGIPFYGRGNGDFPKDTKVTEAVDTPNYFYNWDEDAKASYLTDRSGRLAFSYEDTVSIRYKCEYAVERGLKGVMCWPESGDDEAGTLISTVHEHLFKGQ